MFVFLSSFTLKAFIRDPDFLQDSLFVQTVDKNSALAFCTSPECISLVQQCTAHFKIRLK